MSRYQGLGRGLGSLIPDRSTDNKANRREIADIEITKIEVNPHQPRTKMKAGDLDDLISSIKEHGIIQPLLVSPVRGGYQLIAGERRFRAAQRLGFKTVPVIVRPSEEVEKLELALIENLQREDLNPLDRARAYQQLIDEFSLTQEEVAKKIGQSRSHVANALRLLNLPAEIKKAIIDNTISEGHAKALLSLSTGSEQISYLKRIIDGKLTVREIEQQVRRTTVRRHKRQIAKDPKIAAAEDSIMSVLGTKVNIRKRGAKGQITIDFFSEEELNSIVNKLIT